MAIPKKPLPTSEALHQRLRYDPESGALSWIKSGLPAAQPGVLKHLRYAAINFEGVRYASHRVIWKMVYGADPLGDIDHINGCPWDNRLANLRTATSAENQRNTVRKPNQSGVRGVILYRKKWRASIRHEGKTYFLGDFQTMPEAAAARAAGEKILHGKYAFAQRNKALWPERPDAAARSLNPRIRLYPGPLVSGRRLLPARDDLIEVIRYDPERGLFHFRATGAPIETRVGKYGHRTLVIGGKRFSAHRVAWKIHYGHEPPRYVDHVNRDATDNRIANLRGATARQNVFNRIMPKGKSGLRGVHQSGKKWIVQFSHEGVRHRFGPYEDKNEAYEAYKEQLHRLRGDFAAFA